MSILSGAVDPTYDERGNRIPHSGHLAATFELPDFIGTQWRDFERGRTDIVYFSERFLGIKLHRSQRKFARACALRALDGWRPAYRDICVTAGTRAGKTLVLAVIILWHCIYKIGVRPPDPTDRDDLERWLAAPYAWYHISYRQAIARLVHKEIAGIARGDHPAQFDKATGKKRGCPLTEAMGRGILVTDKLFEGEYEMVQFHPMLGGAIVHFRNTDEQGKGLLGVDMNGISIDEAAFMRYLFNIYNEVLHWRRGVTGGPIISISSPDTAAVDFIDLWERGDPTSASRTPKTYSLRISTRDNIGYGISQEEFDDLVAGMPAWLVAQNIDGEFVEAQDAFFSSQAVKACFIEGMAESTVAEKGHRYVEGCDEGVQQDSSWAIVIDRTDFKREQVDNKVRWTGEIRGVWIDRGTGRQTIVSVVQMITNGHRSYSQDAACTTIFDATSMGGKMFKQELRHIKPCIAFDFAGVATKKIGVLSDLRAVIEKGMLKLPADGRFWRELRRQLLTYKQNDQKLTQDGVMALALAVYHATRNSGIELPPTKVDWWSA